MHFYKNTLFYLIYQRSYVFILEIFITFFNIFKLSKLVLKKMHKIKYLKN